MCEPPSSFLMGFVFWDTGLSAVDPGLVSRPAGRPEFVVVEKWWPSGAVWRAGVAFATSLCCLERPAPCPHAGLSTAC